MNLGIDFNTIFDFIITAAVGFIGWSVKKFYTQIEKKQDAAEIDIKEIRQAVNENNKEMFKTFVTRDDHYRDLNALESKIDGIKDILLDVKEDIGKLTGAQGKGGKNIE